MSKKQEQIGGYWVKNNGMVREVLRHNGRPVYMECGAHVGRDGPDGEKGTTVAGGDIFYIPKSDRNLHHIVKGSTGLMEYGGPLVGQMAHVRLVGEVRFSARSLTAEDVSALPADQLTRPEQSRIAKESKTTDTSSGSANVR